MNVHTTQRGDRVIFRGQVCVVEGLRTGRWYSGDPRREARITAVDAIPGEVRLEGAWVPVMLLQPAPPRPQGDPETTALAVELFRKAGAR